MSHQPFECPVAGCSASRKVGQLMCLRHWRRVPRILQRGVWDTYGRYSRVTASAAALARHGKPVCSLSGELTEARSQYTAAASAAVAAVEAKERAE